MPTNAGFFDSPCVSVRKVYQASQCLSASHQMNPTWNPRFSSSISACGSWSK